MEPGLEALRVTERREVAPCTEERLLSGVLGAVGVAQDPVRKPVAAVDVLGGQAAERILVAGHRPLHQPVSHRTLAMRGPLEPRHRVWNRPIAKRSRGPANGYRPM